MRWLPVCLLLCLATLYQLVALPLYRFGGVAPDFVFLVLAYLGFFVPASRLLPLAGIYSLMLDAFSLDPAGAQAAGLLPVLWLITRLQGLLVVESAVLRCALVFPATLLALLLRRLYVFLLTRVGGTDLGDLFLTALYTTALGIAVHGILDCFRARLGWTRGGHLGAWS